MSNGNHNGIPDFILEYQGLDLSQTKTGNNVRWVNAFSTEFLGKNVKNLYPTETLFGNWNSRILLLAQDALPAAALSKLIKSTIDKGLPKEHAWRHADKVKFGDEKGWKTNEAIKELMEKYAPENDALYGSAAAHMLYADGGTNYRQNLIGFNHPLLTAHLVNVLIWVVKNMPNLEFIMCLGDHAWRIVNQAANSNKVKEFTQYRNNGQYCEARIMERTLKLIPAFHPMAMKTKEEKEKSWKLLSALL